MKEKAKMQIEAKSGNIMQEVTAGGKAGQVPSKSEKGCRENFP